MPCDHVGNAIICSRGSRRSLGRCQDCGLRPAALLCDGPVQNGANATTCDRPICYDCATHVAPNTDYCKTHADPEKRRLAL